MRPFMFQVEAREAEALLRDWRWLVPGELTPLLITVFGDWVFGAPDGSIWMLSVLEGGLEQVAPSSSEFNRKKADFAWLDTVFIAGWQEIAERHGLEPDEGECLGWKLHPLLGGEFDVANLQLFSMSVYQSLMGQLHRQLLGVPLRPGA